jgi:mannitol-specific phosphotransferase system IIBC component
MNYIVATFMLGIFSFINFILALITSTTYGYLKTTLWRASNLTNVTAQTMPLINQIETLFWILFLFSAVSTIVWYVIGSHQDEHESFSRPQEYNRRRY